DLIHGWGIDFQLGYCAQGDRKKKVGVVDAEYIVHLGLATLGGSNHKGSGDIDPGNDRVEVRKQSYNEMHVFRQRWHQAVKGDKCWIDRYRDTNSPFISAWPREEVEMVG
nr:ribonuclease E/G-like protein [Tanacetum cinerariifolium]